MHNEYPVSGIKHRERCIKVLFIIWSLEKGGAERFLVSLVKNFDQRRFNSIVCCLNWKGEWAKELEDNGVELIALNKKSKLDISVIFKLISIIKQHKIDIVNTHLWGADCLGRIAAILSGVPVIISTVQNVDIWKQWWQRMIDRLLSYKTDIFIAVSDAVKEYYHKKIGIPLSKIIVIPNAIEIERFETNGDVSYLFEELQLKSSDFILSCIGRLSEQKGQRYLIESLKELNSEYPNLRVLFVGQGGDSEKLKELTQKDNISHKVRFLGHRRDIPQILHLSDGVILPSLYEGLPVCILEAMAAGKPVIATDVGGTKTIVKDKETGFLVQSKDIGALTLAIKSLLSLPDRGKKMGQKAKELVSSNFSIKSVTKKTEDLFISLANKKEL